MTKNIREILCEQGRNSMCFSAEDVADYGELFDPVREMTMPTDQMSRIAKLTRLFTQSESSGDEIAAKYYFDQIRAFISEH
jgi:hypothetical protein